MTKNDELIGKLVSVADVLKLAKVALNTVHVPQWGARSASLKLVSKVLQAHAQGKGRQLDFRQRRPLDVPGPFPKFECV